MQNRRLKLKQIRQKVFNKRNCFFIAEMEYTQSLLKTFMKSHLSLNPMAKWALATNPVDVQFRTVLEQTIKDKHIENKKIIQIISKNIIQVEQLQILLKNTCQIIKHHWMNLLK